MEIITLKIINKIKNYLKILREVDRL